MKDHNCLDETSISYPNVTFINSSGKSVEIEKCARLIGLCMEILDKTNELEKAKGSLGTFLVRKYEEALKTPEYNDIEKDICYQVLDYFHKFENSIEASDSWYETSANGYTQYWECEGNQLLNWKDRGYKTIFDFITKKRPNSAEGLDVENRIKLNKEVAKISWAGAVCSVECSDGSSYNADHVICTMSLGVLKECHNNLFSPKLPEIKINAIEGELKCFQ